jgi:hypothetical protein
MSACTIGRKGSQNLNSENPVLFNYGDLVKMDLEV